jgi:hypothetical protein
MVTVTRLFALALLFLLARASEAGAQPGHAPAAPPPGDVGPAQAERLFHEGRAAFKAEHYARALELFRASYAAVPSTATLLNIAFAEERLGRVASAWTHLREVVAALPIGDERQQLAQQQLAAVGTRVPWLRIELAAGAPTDARVSIDGQPVVSLLEEQPLDPGHHEIEVTAPGRAPRAYPIDLGEGRRVTLRVEPGPPLARQALAPASRSVPEPELAAPSPAPWIVGGVGVAALATGAITAGIALHERAAAEEACPDPSRCDEEGVGHARTGEILAAVSTATLAVGVAATSAGVVLLLVDDREGDVQRGLGWSVGGLGVAAVVGGAIAGGLALDKKADADAACPDPMRCNDAGVDAASTGRTLALVSTAAIVGGVAALGAGATLLFTAPASTPPSAGGAPQGLALRF